MSLDCKDSPLPDTVRSAGEGGEPTEMDWRRRMERVGKRAFDLAITPVLLVIAAPFILLQVILVRATSRGPALYRQVRIGLDGIPFTILKIRTMYHRIEDQTGPRWTAVGDPGITRVGRILRDLHLDELPQLWNVLVGDMSLVGPRPERPEFVRQLEHAIPGYRERLAVRPGLTGLAQVHLPADKTLDDVRRKLVYDLYYVRYGNLWLDLRLIVCSGLYMARIPFFRSTRYLQIPSQQQVEQGTPVKVAENTPMLQLQAEGA